MGPPAEQLAALATVKDVTVARGRYSGLPREGRLKTCAHRLVVCPKAGGTGFDFRV